MIKIRAKISKRENRKTKEKTNYELVYEKSNKVDKHYLELLRKNTQISKTRSERWDIATNVTEIKMITKEYKEQLYINKQKT